jgi:hypothetical protein
MAGTTDTQGLRFGEITDPISHTTLASLADDIATQLDQADAAATAALKRPVVFVRRVTGQSITANAQAVVTFDNLVYDTHGMVNLGSQPTRVTAVSAAGLGVYTFQARVSAQFSSGTWTAGHISVWKNGTTNLGQRMQWAPRSDMSITCRAFLANVGDYVDLRFEHDGSGTLNITLAEFWVSKVSL